MRRIAVILAFAVTPVCAEDLPPGLDDLSIEGVGYQGRKALEQFYGRSLAVTEGKWEGTFDFAPGGRVTWTKPGGETLRGHFGNGAQHPSMCLDFSYDDSACFDLQQAGDDLKFDTSDSGGFVAHAKRGQPDGALPEPESAFCDPLAAFLNAGRADALDSLIDESREAIQFNAYLEPSYWTRVQFGDDACRYDTNGLGPAINCDFFFADDAPEAEDLYEKVIGLAQSCAPREVEDARIDMETWLRYSEFDFVKTKTRKKAKKDYHPSKDDVLRRSTIRFTGNVELGVDTGYRSICTSVVDCKYYYGTWLRFEHRK